MNEYIVHNAYLFAKKAHKGQAYNGRSFMYHPMQVKKIITFLFPLDYELQAAAILHDTVEDCGITYKTLKEEFGERVAKLVREVTKKKPMDKSRSAYFPHLYTLKGIILKFADRLCNLSNMDNWPEHKKQWYLNKSKFWKNNET
jgi:GTP pyrophosphokinase